MKCLFHTLNVTLRKHHFASVKNDVIPHTKCSWNCFNNNNLFLCHPLQSHLNPLQVENCESNSRLVVDEDDNSKIRLERVKHQDLQMVALKLDKLGNFLLT